MMVSRHVFENPGYYVSAAIGKIEGAPPAFARADGAVSLWRYTDPVAAHAGMLGAGGADGGVRLDGAHCR